MSVLENCLNKTRCTLCELQKSVNQQKFKKGVPKTDKAIYALDTRILGIFEKIVLL